MACATNHSPPPHFKQRCNVVIANRINTQTHDRFMGMRPHFSSTIIEANYATYLVRAMAGLCRDGDAVGLCHVL